MTIATLVLALLTAADGERTARPVLLDFHAAWCGPCQKMRPEVEALVQKHYPVRSIDIDADAELARRYDVTSVPTFIVVDPQGRSLARTEGYQPAGQLAELYHKARAKLPATASAPPVASPRAESESESESDEAVETSNPGPNPEPWKTVVRIKVHGSHSIGFGSGTIIRSTPEETIILTCAHIFHIEGARTQPHPRRFPRQITVDLFDGRLRGQVVRPVATVRGEALDYDFTSDVGLIVIRPGRALAAARVVPMTWQPRANMRMTTVGCSEGNDATAWTTRITNPQIRGAVAGRPSYEAIECLHAPKQGRSGGGLFTDDGFVAGVCDFADPNNNRGLYASPQSIRRMLDRNELTVCYQPAASPSRPGALLAKARGTAGPRVVRAQNPDRDEEKLITVPRPELLGIADPSDAPRPTLRRSRAQTHSSWRPASDGAPGGSDPADEALAATPAAAPAQESPRATDLQLSPALDNDPFSPGTLGEEERPSRHDPAPTGSTSGWRPVRTDR